MKRWRDEYVRNLQGHLYPGSPGPVQDPLGPADSLTPGDLSPQELAVFRTATLLDIKVTARDVRRLVTAYLMVPPATGHATDRTRMHVQPGMTWFRDATGQLGIEVAGQRVLLPGGFSDLEDGYHALESAEAAYRQAGGRDERAGRRCQVCGHHATHRTAPGGGNWPATVLSCASCPDGRCVLPGPGTDG